MMVGNPHANAGQMVDSALSDLIAGALEFEFGNAKRLSVERGVARGDCGAFSFAEHRDDSQR
jgi:hypothetical protein